MKRGENWSTRKKPLEASTRTNNKLNPHMTTSLGIVSGQHWREMSALTTAPYRHTPHEVNTSSSGLFG